MLKISNTLTRKKEEFKPLNPPVINMYTCGVTVYDDCHIGHARSLYIFEVMRRYLKFDGYKVNFVRNITDVDDKIINRANELKLEVKELVDKYIEAYYQDLNSLGVMPADFEPRATENITEMIEHIKALIEKGFAYQTKSGVYFSVRKFKGYGKLSGQSVDQMLEGVRKTTDETKEDPLDFALWKSAKVGEPFWESPWGKGRPGWHIECSAMSSKYLKTETLDIHAGGLDLVFPHHENEIAQSEALSGKPFAKYWIHHGLLTINAQKMSKSLGNFITIKGFIDKFADIDYLKLFFLSAHYASPVDYAEAKIIETKKAKERFVILMNKIEKEILNLKDLQVMTKGSDLSETENFRERFQIAMEDDFNTPRALAVLFDLVTFANKFIQDKTKFSSDELEKIRSIRELLLSLTNVLGLDITCKVSKADVGNLTDNEIDGLTQKRNLAKKNKDFKAADAIRSQLDKEGIILEDSKTGTTWRRKS